MKKFRYHLAQIVLVYQLFRKYLKLLIVANNLFNHILELLSLIFNYYIKSNKLNYAIFFKMGI